MADPEQTQDPEVHIETTPPPLEELLEKGIEEAPPPPDAVPPLPDASARMPMVPSYQTPIAPDFPPPPDPVPELPPPAPAALVEIPSLEIPPTMPPPAVRPSLPPVLEAQPPDAVPPLPPPDDLDSMFDDDVDEDAPQPAPTQLIACAVLKHNDAHIMPGEVVTHLSAEDEADLLARGAIERR